MIGDRPGRENVIPVWGGFECSVVRIGDSYRDQMLETGHADREGDLEIVPQLGLKALRYCIPWEHVAPAVSAPKDWRRSDAGMARLRALGIRPIVGLLHHGSGPRHTSLVDPAFPELLAEYAHAVATRYPWVMDFTPVNEPGTTARFSCLYGHWFPHRRESAAFLLALFNQAYATALSMRAIRTIVPGARLVQTEELGRVYATPPLAYQAAYENERRWLSLDLLCGRVSPAHGWWQAFCDAGVSEHHLADLLRHPSPPDIIGINYYLTSDRFLDHRVENFPVERHGGNGRDAYVDCEAIRSPEAPSRSRLTARLVEAWRRYRLPLAITEVHNGCTREEQMRWLTDCHRWARGAQARGVDIRGFTIWALAGAVDWNSLLTRRSGHYESGVLEARNGLVRMTAMAGAVRALARTGRYRHHLAEGRGWWKRRSRFESNAPPAPEIIGGRTLLIAGASGTLGAAFARICRQRGLKAKLCTRQDMDIADEASVQQAIERERPWAIINAAGYVRIRGAEREPERCHRENCMGAEILARASSRSGIPLVTFSSDRVFDGRLGRPYVETDHPNPESTYGISKADAERCVAACQPEALIIRASTFFGPWDCDNSVYAVLAHLKAGHPVVIPADSRISLSYLPDLVGRTLDLLIDGEAGLWHLANGSTTSWGDLALCLATRGGFDPALVMSQSDTASGYGLDRSLASLRGLALPPLDGALDRYLGELGAA